MTHLNAVQIRGIVNNEPAFYDNKDKTEMIRLTVAVNRRLPSTAKDCFDVIAWGEDARHIHEEFHEGMAIDVIGRLRKSWYSVNSRRYSAVDIVAEQVTHPLTEGDDIS